MMSPSSARAKIGNVEVVDPWVCPAGGTHQWTYQGKGTTRYRCTECSNWILKRRLKEETDDA